MLMRAVPRPVAGLSLAIVLTVAAACGSNPKVQKAPVAPAESAPAPAEVPPPPPPPDPISALIQTSQDHFVAGERELKLGHLERARIEFDRAVDVLLESPYGARTDALRARMLGILFVVSEDDHDQRDLHEEHQTDQGGKVEKVTRHERLTFLSA